MNEIDRMEVNWTVNRGLRSYHGQQDVLCGRAGAWSWAGTKSKSSVCLSKKLGKPIYVLHILGEIVRLALSAGWNIDIYTSRPSIAS